MGSSRVSFAIEAVNNGDTDLSSFDKDFGRKFEPVEETMVLGGLASKLVERFAPDDPEIVKEYRIRIVDPNNEEWAYPIHGEVMIGRAPDNHVTLNDRSVSRHHLALNTDGKLYWFQDLQSGNGTQVNGEFMQEGWLIGGEEIVVGNSRIYFMQPDIEVPPELSEAISTQAQVNEPGESSESMEASTSVETSDDEDKDPQPAPFEQVVTPPDAGSTQWLIGFVLLAGLVIAGIAGLWLYRRNQAPKPEKRPVVRKVSPERKAFQLLEKGERLIKQKKWAAADKLLREGAMILPEGSAVRTTILARAKVAQLELRAIRNYKSGNKLYRFKFQAKEALEFLYKVPDKSSVSGKAKALIKLIQSKELDNKLKMASVLFENNKKDQAISMVKSALVIDPQYNKARAMLKKLTIAPVAPVAPRPAPVRRTVNRRVINASLSSGVGYYRGGQLARAIIFFRRLESGGRTRRIRRRARSYRRSVQTYQRYYNRGRNAYRRGRVPRGISYLSRAYRADRALGGAHRSKIAKMLSTLYYRQGRAQKRRGRYNLAAGSFKNALRYNSRQTKAHLELKSLRRKAKALLDEGEVLIGVSNSDARAKISQAKRLLSTSDPLYRKATQLLNRMR